MKEFLHVFQNDSEFNGSYNGNNYSEPWVSYTKTVETKDCDSVQVTINGNGPYTYTFLFKEEEEDWHSYDFATNVVDVPITSVNTTQHTFVASGKTFYFGTSIDDEICIWQTNTNPNYEAVTKCGNTPSINDIAQIVPFFSASTTITAVGNNTITVNGNVYTFDSQTSEGCWWLYEYNDGTYDSYDSVFTTSRTPTVGTVVTGEISWLHMPDRNPVIGTTFYMSGNIIQITSVHQEIVDTYRVNYNKKATDEPLTLEFLENGTFRIEEYLPWG